MKAIVYHKNGSPDVLKLEDFPKPTPGDNEDLIKIHAAALNVYDWCLLKADPFLISLMGFGFFKPKTNY